MNGERSGSGLGEHAGCFAIEAAFTGGDPRKLRNTERVVAAVLESPHRVEELLDCVFSEDEIVRMRASDALEKVCRRQPTLLEPFVERLVVEMAAVDQPSVQWHLAQILGEVPLRGEQRNRAVAILRRNLATSGDWIVINLSLQTFAGFAREDAALRPELVAVLHRHEDSRYVSVASRVGKLLAEFGG